MFSQRLWSFNIVFSLLLIGNILSTSLNSICTDNTGFPFLFQNDQILSIDGNFDNNYVFAGLTSGSQNFYGLIDQSSSPSTLQFANILPFSTMQIDVKFTSSDQLDSISSTQQRIGLTLVLTEMGVIKIRVFFISPTSGGIIQALYTDTGSIPLDSQLIGSWIFQKTGPETYIFPLCFSPSTQTSFLRRFIDNSIPGPLALSFPSFSADAISNFWEEEILCFIGNEIKPLLQISIYCIENPIQTTLLIPPLIKQFSTNFGSSTEWKMQKLFYFVQGTTPLVFAALEKIVPSYYLLFTVLDFSTFSYQGQLLMTQSSLNDVPIVSASVMGIGIADILSGQAIVIFCFQYILDDLNSIMIISKATWTYASASFSNLVHSKIVSLSGFPSSFNLMRKAFFDGGIGVFIGKLHSLQNDFGERINQNSEFGFLLSNAEYGCSRVESIPTPITLSTDLASSSILNFVLAITPLSPNDTSNDVSFFLTSPSQAIYSNPVNDNIECVPSFPTPYKRFLNVTIEGPQQTMTLDNFAIICPSPPLNVLTFDGIVNQSGGALTIHYDSATFQLTVSANLGSLPQTYTLYHKSSSESQQGFGEIFITTFNCLCCSDTIFESGWTPSPQLVYESNDGNLIIDFPTPIQVSPAQSTSTSCNIIYSLLDQGISGINAYFNFREIQFPAFNSSFWYRNVNFAIQATLSNFANDSYQFTIFVQPPCLNGSFSKPPMQDLFLYQVFNRQFENSFPVWTFSPSYCLPQISIQTVTENNVVSQTEIDIGSFWIYTEDNVQIGTFNITKYGLYDSTIITSQSVQIKIVANPCLNLVPKVTHNQNVTSYIIGDSPRAIPLLYKNTIQVNDLCEDNLLVAFDQSYDENSLFAFESDTLVYSPILTTDFSKAGLHNATFKFFYFLNETYGLNLSYQFNFIDCENGNTIVAPPSVQIAYTIGSPMLTSVLGTFQSQHPPCLDKIIFKCTDQDSRAPCDTSILSNIHTGGTIFTNDPSKIGVYNLKVEAYSNLIMMGSTTMKVVIIDRSIISNTSSYHIEPGQPPQFVTIPKDVEILPNQDTLKLPAIAYFNVSQLEVSVEIQPQRDFVSFSHVTQSLQIEQKAITQNEWITISAYLSDPSNPSLKQQAYSFKIFVSMLTEESSSGLNNESSSLSSVIPDISKITQFGEVTITFSKSILVPSNYENLDEKVISIKVLPFSKNALDNKNLSLVWHVSKFFSHSMTIQVNFSHPLDVSQLVTKLSIKLLFRVKINCKLHSLMDSASFLKLEEICRFQNFFQQEEESLLNLSSPQVQHSSLITLPILNQLFNNLSSQSFFSTFYCKIFI